MANVPHRTVSRDSHRSRSRASHQDNAYAPSLAAYQDVYQQIGVDGTVGPGDIPPGTVDGGVLIPGSIDITPFASNIRPVLLESSDPVLPDADYPAGQFIYRTDINVLKKTEDGLTWVLAVGPGDIQANSITAGQIAAGAISTSELDAGAVTTAKLATGAITLYDESGAVALEPAGFGSVWSRFIKSGFFNGDFYAPAASLVSVIDDVTNPLPKWSFGQGSGTAVTAKSVAAATNGSGYAVRFTMTAGAANDRAHIEQIVPINASVNRGYTWGGYVHAELVSASIAADVEVFVEIQYLTRAGVATGAAGTGFWGGGLLPAEVTATGIDGNVPPADAYFARFRCGVRRRSGGSNAVTAVVQFNEVFTIVGAPRVHLADVSAPGTYSRAVMLQYGGALYLGAATEGMPNFAGPMLALDSVSNNVTSYGDSFIVYDAPVRVELGTPTAEAYSSGNWSDSNRRFSMSGTGVLEWGDGTAVVDTNLYRSAANVLKTDDAFTATGVITAPSFVATNQAIPYGMVVIPFGMTSITGTGTVEIPVSANAGGSVQQRAFGKWKVVAVTVATLSNRTAGTLVAQAYNGSLATLVGPTATIDGTTTNSAIGSASYDTTHDIGTTQLIRLRITTVGYTPTANAVTGLLWLAWVP